MQIERPFRGRLLTVCYSTRTAAKVPLQSPPSSHLCSHPEPKVDIADHTRGDSRIAATKRSYDRVSKQSEGSHCLYSLVVRGP
jgi:hypothetical protein